jgi:hypothetical protein
MTSIEPEWCLRNQASAHLSQSVSADLTCFHNYYYYCYCYTLVDYSSLESTKQLLIRVNQITVQLNRQQSSIPPSTPSLTQPKER